MGDLSKAVLIGWWGREVLVGAEEGMGGKDSEKGCGEPPRGAAWPGIPACVPVCAQVCMGESMCMFTMGGVRYDSLLRG